MMDASKGPAPSDPYVFSDDFDEPASSSASKKVSSADVLKIEPVENSVSARTSEERSRDISSKEVLAEKLPFATTTSLPVQKTILDCSKSVTHESPVAEDVVEGTSKSIEIPAAASQAKVPILPALEILKKNDRDLDVGNSSPVGSPLTPDSLENVGTDQSDREASPASRKKRTKNRRQESPVTTTTTDASTSKRRPGTTDFPGSPQTVVSERRQLALLRQQARDTEKQKSPDTSFSRDGPSTPSSTGSSKEARSANRRDGKGETPLHVACKKGDLIAVKKLLDDGADVNAADNAGWTPLHEAANHGREDVTRLLVKNGANLSARAVDGLTPLMDAVINGHLSIVKVLLKSGADPNCENDKGESCLDLAEERDIFKDLFLTYKKDLDQDPSRKRKREADGGMMSGASKGLPEAAILLQATGKGSMEGKIPALAAISSSTEMPKDKSESQYEDISEDEEEAVVDGPTVVSPHLDTLVPATASSTQTQFSSTNLTPLLESITSHPSTLSISVLPPQTSSVSGVPAAGRPIPKLRPPSPVPMTPSIINIAEAVVPAASPASIGGQSPEKPEALKKDTGTLAPAVSSENAVLFQRLEERNLLPELKEKLFAKQDAALTSVPVHQASAMPPSTSETFLVEEPVPQTIDGEVESANRPAASEEASPEIRYTVTDFGMVTLSKDKAVEIEALLPEGLTPPEAKNPLVDLPISSETETSVPSTTASTQQEISSGLPLGEENSVDTTSPVLALTEAPVAPSTQSIVSKAASAVVLISPSSLTVKLPAISTKMPPALPIASGVSLAVPPPLVFPAVLTTSPAKSISLAEAKKDKKLEKNKETPAKVSLAGTSFLPQGPPQERLMLTVKRTPKDTLKDIGDESKERETGVMLRLDESSTSAGALVEFETPPKGKAATESAHRASEPTTSPSKKQKEEKQAKPMTRAQRAQAQTTPQSTGPGRRRKDKDEKQPRGRPSKRAAADADIQSGEDAGGLDTKPKRLSVRISPKKLKANKEGSSSPAKLTIQDVAKSPVELLVESAARLPFKKRLSIRNEIEEFINQRRQVEENWKKYTNNFPMKVFPKNCNDYLILRKNYSLEAALPKKLDAPLALPPALKDFFVEQAEERSRLIRTHVIERDRLVMGAEQEMMRLHQRFCRITAGITIPYSACMIISEQDSNRSFQNQEQEERTRNATRNRISMRDLIKWLEESDDKFDYAKKELLTRHRLEAAMLRSKQRLDWAWKASDLNLIDPSCRNPEELPNLYVPEVVVEDFVLLPDNL